MEFYVPFNNLVQILKGPNIPFCNDVDLNPQLQMLNTSDLHVSHFNHSPTCLFNSEAFDVIKATVTLANNISNSAINLNK